MAISETPPGQYAPVPDDGGDIRAAARALLDLPDPSSRLSAWLDSMPAPHLARVLHRTAEILRDETHSVLRVTQLDLVHGCRAVHLDLLLLPSVFEPGEEWGSAFVQGLLRRPSRSYQGKRLIEMGIGSGWVSIALLKLTGLRDALGVDLNPEAVLVSRLNAILNGFDPDGRPAPDRCADRFAAVASNLLAEPRRSRQRADLVIGCLPQVPDPAAALGRMPHDLNNYADPQGVAEDRFGLGLNARALREAVHLLEPGGSVILNVAERPGLAAVRGMFRRAGFETETLWRSIVRQASDTDIAALVELEERTGHPFVFHLHRHSPHSIPARLAARALAAGLPVHHAIRTVEARVRSQAVAPLAAALAELDLDGLWQDLDLSAQDDLLDERLRYSAALAQQLLADPRAPYPHEAGDLSLRESVADFLARVHGIALAPDETFLGPDRAAVLHATLLALTCPGDRVAVSESLRHVAAGALGKAEVDAMWLHEDTDEITELLPHLRPRLVVLAAPARDLTRVLRVCADIDAMAVLDISESVSLGPEAVPVPALSLLAQDEDNGYLAILAGLPHSRAVPGIQLAALLTRNRALHRGLATAAELTWSRISYLHQAYYTSLLDELLSAHIRRPVAKSGPPPGPGPALASTMRELLLTPAFARPAPSQDVIRLDYGENELPLPPALRKAILHGLLAPSQLPAGSRPVGGAEAVADYLRATRLPELTREQVVLGSGTMPLLFDALRTLRLRLSRPPIVLLPHGSYGMFTPLITAAGAKAVPLPTQPPRFLVSPDAVSDAEPFDALVLTNPANPSGASYSPEELRDLTARTAARGAMLILDEVFGLLADLDGPLPLAADRWYGLDHVQRRALVVLGGLSKEFAAGGLRLGFAAMADPQWAAALRDQRLTPVPAHLWTIAERLFADLPALWPQIDQLRARLRDHRDILASGLRELGFGVPAEHHGGMFLLPDLSPLADDPEGLVLRLETHARVRLNTPAWSGTTHHARACFAVPKPVLEQALDRLSSHLTGPAADR